MKKMELIIGMTAIVAYLFLSYRFISGLATFSFMNFGYISILLAMGFYNLEKYFSSHFFKILAGVASIIVALLMAVGCFFVNETEPKWWMVVLMVFFLIIGFLDLFPSIKKNDPVH